MQQRGKIANIGLTNFDVLRVQQMVDAGVPVVSNQVPDRTRMGVDSRQPRRPAAWSREAACLTSDSTACRRCETCLGCNDNPKRNLLP